MLVATLLLSTYVICIYIIFGIQKSVSWSWYKLDTDHHIIFRAVFIGSALSIFLSQDLITMKIGAIGLSCVGIFANCAKGWRRYAHIIGISTGILFFYISLIVVNVTLGSVIVILVAIESYDMYKNRNKDNYYMWNIELYIMISMVIGYYLEYFINLNR